MVTSKPWSVTRSKKTPEEPLGELDGQVLTSAQYSRPSISTSQGKNDVERANSPLIDRRPMLTSVVSVRDHRAFASKNHSARRTMIQASRAGSRDRARAV
jgi:hypothetical protein